MTCPAGPLCGEAQRLEDLAARARAGEVDREEAIRHLEVWGQMAITLGETAVDRARELRQAPASRSN